MACFYFQNLSKCIYLRNFLALLSLSRDAPFFDELLTELFPSFRVFFADFDPVTVFFLSSDSFYFFFLSDLLVRGSFLELFLDDFFEFLEEDLLFLEVEERDFFSDDLDELLFEDFLDDRFFLDRSRKPSG